MDEIATSHHPTRDDDNPPNSLNGNKVEEEPPAAGGYSVRSDPDDLVMCRVCRGNEGELYYPCLCTGSIKYVHQECLVQWLKYSKKEKCELCSYKYSFQPIYRPDMPKILPIIDIAKGIAVSLASVVKTWLIYSIVMFGWLFIVPLTAARIYNAIFYFSFQDIVTSPWNVFKVENVLGEIGKGALLLLIFVCTFISLVWLREQIISGGPQGFLNIENNGEDEEEEEEEAEDDGTELEERIEGYEQNEEDDGSDEDVEDDDEDEEEVEAAQEQHINNDENNEDANREPVAAPAPPAPPQPRRRREERRRDDQDAEDNWRDWDRIGEDLTWQRILGLDGSLIFIEHFFWVISLNTFFTIIFAYIPYRFGQYILVALDVLPKISHFPSIISMLCGYVIITAVIYLFHSLVGALRMKSLYRFLGIMFLILKVFLLVLIEIGIFPIMCGWWIDICTLKLFNASLNQRIATFSNAPFMSVFIHWMIGMVYVFYSASFVILLREILRPGVMWFMRNLNDPDFNPIQEMIDLPFGRHLRRFIVSTTLFFTTIMLIFYIPLNLIKEFLSWILPYNVSISAETPLSEPSLDFLVLQVVVPVLLEQTSCRTVIKAAIRGWCVVVGKALDLDRYLLSDANSHVNNNNNNNNNNERGAGIVGAQDGGLAAEHQALLLLREPRAFEPYVRPKNFALRIVLLISMMALTTTVVSTISFIVPVSIGRYIVSYLTGQSNVHEIYTLAMGFYVIRLPIFAYFGVFEVEGWQNMIVKMFKRSFKLLLIFVPGFVIIPCLIGTLYRYIFLTPYRVSFYETPISFFGEDWAHGLLFLKTICVYIMIAPDSWMKVEMNEIINQGLMEFDVLRAFMRLILPVMMYLAGIIVAPVVLCYTYYLFTDISEDMLFYMIRCSYQPALFVVLGIVFLKWQMSKLQDLTQQIKNERYLVGTKLVNYERNEQNQSS